MIAAPSAQLVRLVLGDPRLDADDLDWSLLLPCAARHQLELRLAAWFERVGEVAPPLAAELFARARADASATLAQTARVDDRLRQADAQYVFLDVARQIPDLGRGVGLLMSGPPPDVDMEAFVHVPASTLRFGALLLRHRRRLVRGDTGWTAPADDIALVFQALHYRHDAGGNSLGRIVWALALLRAGSIDPDGLAARMRAADAGALTTYLTSLGRIHQQLFGTALPDERLRARLTAGDLRPRADNRRSHTDA